jgi:hypothetical protein
MPHYTYEYIISSLVASMIAGSFFKEWRRPGTVVFVFSWQMLTPIRPLSEDVLMLVACWICTELLFGFLQKK